jgi:hypothetical protein
VAKRRVVTLHYAEFRGPGFVLMTRCIARASWADERAWCLERAGAGFQTRQSLRSAFIDGLAGLHVEEFIDDLSDDGFLEVLEESFGR